MSLRHLNIFVTVMRLESITKAAEELHIAQPSVSLAISQLEEHYGQRLFDRIGRRIYPTEAGKELYRYALRMVSLYEDMEKRMGNPDAHGTIRIGASITIGTCLLPHLSNTYKEMYPGQKKNCGLSLTVPILSCRWKESGTRCPTVVKCALRWRSRIIIWTGRRSLYR